MSIVDRIRLGEFKTIKTIPNPVIVYRWRHISEENVHETRDPDEILAGMGYPAGRPIGLRSTEAVIETANGLARAGNFWFSHLIDGAATAAGENGYHTEAEVDYCRFMTALAAEWGFEVEDPVFRAAFSFALGQNSDPEEIAFLFGEMRGVFDAIDTKLKIAREKETK